MSERWGGGGEGVRMNCSEKGTTRRAERARGREAARQWVTAWQGERFA